MALPKVAYPTFKVEIPSTQEQKRFRPFTVKEEKILLLAHGGSAEEIFDAVLQVVNNCNVDDLDCSDLTTFDIEYIFIKLRAKSVNNIIEIDWIDNEDGKSYPLKINLDDVQIKRDPNHTNIVKINEVSGIMLRYPKPQMVHSLTNVQTENDLAFEVVKYCIDSVYDADSIYSVHDGSNTDEEINEFVESLESTTIEKIQQFIDSAPKLTHTVTYEKQDGREAEAHFKTLSDFFTLG